MPGTQLDEDAIDEILFLARANEAAELSTYLTELSAQTKQSTPDLVASAVDPYSKNSALHYAAANGHIDVLKLLLQNTDNPTASASGLINAVNDAGNTALHWAALNGHLESTKLLVQAGADVTIINKAGHDAVFEAEINDKGTVVEWLLAAVEELEQGIGETNGGSAKPEEASDEQVTHGTAGDSPNEESEPDNMAVEDARKQMEDLETRDVAPRGG